MKFYYNQNQQITIFYPESWFDTMKNLFILLFFSNFKRTWYGNSNRFSKHVIGCIESKVTPTYYPDEAGC